MAIHRLLTLLLCLGLTSSCAGQPASRPVTDDAAQAARQEVSLFDPDLHLRTTDVRIGMKGYGLSVFKGSAIERFEVEVMAILRNSEQIGTEVVLIRASGAGLEHTGPIAGMSGSPVYLHCDDGKERLLGAFAFGWPGLKDPIAGVQPIEAMLELDSTPRPAEPAARAVVSEPPSWNLLSGRAIGKLLESRPRSLAELTGLRREPAPAQTPGQLQPLALPLTVSGFAPGVAQNLAASMATSGLAPMLPLDAQPAGGRNTADRVEPGSPLIIPMLIGDLNMVATGTCTVVIGDRVFGLGHPMFGDGRTALPLAAGEVDAVIPTHDISFKLGSAGKILGTLATDAVAGVAGTLGPVPPMIPVSLTVQRGEQTQTFRFQAARHEQLTPLVLGAAAQSAVDFRGAPDTQGATRWDVTLRYSGGRTLRLRDIAPNDDPFGGGFVGSLVLPLQALQENPFGAVELESIEGGIQLLPASAVQMATLEEMSLPRQRYRPGETVKINLVFLLHRGERVHRSVELKLPDDLSPGDYPLTLADSAAALGAAAQNRPFEFEVKSLDDLFSLINSVQDFGAEAVYIRLDRPEQVRVAVGRQALPDLPGSRALLLAESGRSEITTFATSISSKVELPFVVTGGEAEAIITVTRP